MLKTSALVLAVLAVSTVGAGASVAADLIVGSVRDQDGSPIAEAEIRALDARGTLAGTDRSDDLGTFALSPSRPASRVEVRCPHCRAASFSLANGTNLAIVVTRYRALESDVPSREDLAALPYGTPSDALALVPFVLGGNGVGELSDRGLGGGHGLVSDNGAPLVDLATGTPASLDFPARYVRDLTVVRADRAYRYGPYAGGGLFALDSLAPAGSAWTDVGSAPALALASVTGNLHPALGISNDGTLLSRRGDLDLTTPFAGGALRAGATSASERVVLGSGDRQRDIASVHVAYATASRQYRTSGDFSASEVGVSGGATGASDYRASYLSGNVRIERPGDVDLAAGLRATSETAYYAVRPPQSYALVGRSEDETLYVEAARTIGATSVHAALALADVFADETLSENTTLRGTRLALLPAIDARTKLGQGTYVRAGYSQSQRLPTLLESDGIALPRSSLAVERAELAESAIGYDAGGRVRAEAIVYRELTHGFVERRLDGLGASLVWQVAPLVSVRAWSLRAAPQDFANSAYATEDATRHVLWATYANGSGLRFDAILHRDAGDGRLAAIALDGDAYVPLAERIVLDAGTSRRANVRRYYFGLRLR